MGDWLGLKYGVVSCSAGETAAEHSAYQAGGRAVDMHSVARERRLGPGEHVRQWVLAPRNAPAWAKDPGRLWREAARAERQWNAQQARFLDLQIPREFPEAAIDDLVHALYDRCVKDGLVVQVDYHVSLARDGGRNPHLHGLISTRRIGPGGFERTKTAARIWNTIFRDDGGREIRRFVAEAVNGVAAQHGGVLHIDPRPNWERGLPAPEPRLPRSVVRKTGTAYASGKIAERDRHRALRAEWNVARDKANRAEVDVDALKRAIAAKRAAMPSIAPVAPTLGAAFVEKCQTAVDFAPLYGWSVAGFEVKSERAVIIAFAEAELIVEPDRAFIDGLVDEDVCDFLGGLVADLGWDVVNVFAADRNEQVRLRRSIRRTGRSRDPRTFEIAALYGDRNVADVIEAFRATAGANLAGETNRKEYFSQHGISPSTRQIFDVLLAEQDLEDELFQSMDTAAIYRARVEMRGVWLSQCAQRLKARVGLRPQASSAVIRGGG